VQTIWAHAREGRTEEAREAWLASALFAPAMEQPSVAARLREMIRDFGWWRVRHPGLEQPLQPPARGRLDAIDAPTLVVVGERERPGVRAGCDELAARIPGAQLVELARVGHMSNMEDPAAFNAAVLEFLAKL
jgi:pimeloyl-ACP methyl ester carboxylesterase